MIKSWQNLALIIAAVVIQSCKSSDFNVTKFGAIGDGKALCTQSIQSAIDACAESGGGQVIIPKGTFISGTLYLNNNVNLHLDSQAVLKGSSSFSDYPNNAVKYVNSFSYPNGKLFENKALIFAEGVSNISVTGKGTIDGNGNSPAFQLGNDGTPESRRRPCTLLFINCKKVTVADLNLRNSAYWMQNYLGCDTVTLRNLNVFNHSNYNQDATDIDASNVLVEHCNIDADDDGICLKSHDKNRPVSNVIIRNCTIATNCNAIKFGTKSEGGFKNITITNCKIKRASVDYVRKWQQNLQFIGQAVTVLAGIALETVDGGTIDNVNISDVKMTDVQTPIFVIAGRRNVGQAGGKSFYNSSGEKLQAGLKAGKILNLHFKNVTAVSHSKMASSISAAPGNYIENVTLDNISISSMGKGTNAEANGLLPEYSGSYPENRMYGFSYPASGLYLRHIKNITLSNINLSVRSEDYRPAVILDDVQYGLLSSLKVNQPAGENKPIQFIRSNNIRTDASATAVASHKNFRNQLK